jgi:hypothetical protein
MKTSVSRDAETGYVLESGPIGVDSDSYKSMGELVRATLGGMLAARIDTVDLVVSHLERRDLK